MATLLSIILILFSGFVMGASVYYNQAKPLSAAIALSAISLIGFFMMRLQKAVFAGKRTEYEKKLIVFSVFLVILIVAFNVAVYVATH